MFLSTEDVRGSIEILFMDLNVKVLINMEIQIPFKQNCNLVEQHPTQKLQHICKRDVRIINIS